MDRMNLRWVAVALWSAVGVACSSGPSAGGSNGDAAGDSDTGCTVTSVQASASCDSGDLYWFDSCGDRAALNRDCCGQACTADACAAPIAEVSSACDGGDLYWFDSCDLVGALEDNCTARETCLDTTSTTAECSSLCGDGVINQGEESDGTLGGNACDSVG